jgi:hypothetical protein
MTPVTKSGLPITPSSNRNPKQTDPAVVARAMEMLKAQREPNSPPLTRPGISTTAQQSLSLSDGQYVGDVKDGVPHGRGKLTYYPGEVRKKYEGQWENGQFHGRGILKFSNGDQFEGQWENGLQHGEGLRTLANGTKYEGSFERGNRHGKGTCNYANGDTYVGDWENDKFHGIGTYTYTNKDPSMNQTTGEYVGEWQNGMRNGQGKYTSSEHEIIYTGEWLDDQKHGQGRGEFNFEYGSVHEGIFRNNKLWTGTSTGQLGVTRIYQDGEDVTNPIKEFCFDYVYCGGACPCSVM